jgi:hypothetical protein
MTESGRRSTTQPAIPTRTAPQRRRRRRNFQKYGLEKHSRIYKQDLNPAISRGRVDILVYIFFIFFDEKDYFIVIF